MRMWLLALFMEGIWKTLTQELKDAETQRSNISTYNEINDTISSFEKSESLDFTEVLNQSVSCVLSDDLNKENIMKSFEILSKIAQISTDFPKNLFAKCWEFISIEDDDVSNAAANFLCIFFTKTDKAYLMYGEDLPSLLASIFNRNKISKIHSSLFLSIALKNEDTREICINEELSGILTSKLSEAPDPDSLAAILKIINGIYDYSPTIKENLPELISSIEDKFCTDNENLYIEFLISIQTFLHNSNSAEFLCSFCESKLFQQVMSTLSLKNIFSTKILISIVHSILGGEDGIHATQIHKALVDANIFEIIHGILLSPNEELFKYCYAISTELFNYVQEFRSQFFSSELPGFLVESFDEMNTKTKKEILNFLSCVSRFASSNEVIFEYFIENEIILRVSENFDLNEALGFSIAIIKNVLSAGIKLQGTEIYDTFIEQIFNDDFVDAIDDKIDNFSENGCDDDYDDDDDDEDYSGSDDDSSESIIYDKSNEDNTQDLYDIKSIIDMLKSQ